MLLVAQLVRRVGFSAGVVEGGKGGRRGLAAPGGFVLGHRHAYITNNSILSDAGQVGKVAI